MQDVRTQLSTAFSGMVLEARTQDSWDNVLNVSGHSAWPMTDIKVHLKSFGSMWE